MKPSMQVVPADLRREGGAATRAPEIGGPLGMEPNWRGQEGAGVGTRSYGGAGVQVNGSPATGGHHVASARPRPLKRRKERPQRARAAADLTRLFAYGPRV